MTRPASSASDADTRYISTREGVASPIIAQIMDSAEGQHWFSFLCPQSREPLPQYRPIDDDVGVARAALDACAVYRPARQLPLFDD